ncbi:hypothetical protein C0995_001206 [Termitomyces sp. Mi166|nr:hypothetical protein C0995_001206 [Termitomyces sp. Mi166\
MKLMQIKIDSLCEYLGPVHRFKFSARIFCDRGELPDGWEQCTHPEGQPYFYHAEKRIITECWIWDEKMFIILDGFIDQFEDFTRSRNLSQPEDVDLLLEVNIEDGVKWCGYYYVSASTRSVFWLEPFDISFHVAEVRGEVSSTHISKGSALRPLAP